MGNLAQGVITSGGSPPQGQEPMTGIRWRADSWIASLNHINFGLRKSSLWFPPPRWCTHHPSFRSLLPPQSPLSLGKSFLGEQVAFGLRLIWTDLGGVPSDWVHLHRDQGDPGRRSPSP